MQRFEHPGFNDLKPHHTREQNSQAAVREPPEIPGDLVLRPCKMGMVECQPAVGEHPIDLDRENPRHRKVLEHAVGKHRVELPLREVFTQAMSIADDVGIGVAVVVETRIRCGTVKQVALADAAWRNNAGPDLQHMHTVLIDLLDKPVEQRTPSDRLFVLRGAR